MPDHGAIPAAFVKASRRRRNPNVRLLRRSLTLGVCVVAFAICWRVAEIQPSTLLERDSLASVGKFLRELFPPDLSAGSLRIVLAAVKQTVAIAIAGTVLSILVGLPLGIMATATLWRRGVLLAGEPKGAFTFLLAGVSRFTRGLLGFLRAVPDLMWGLLFVVAVGLGPLAGTLALAVSYGGVIGRIYADIFEDVDPRPLEALHAAGATRGQIFLRAIWPQAKPNFVAYTLYSFECCVRAATVLGFVGAGGIGYEINISMRLFEYRQVLTLILAFIGLLAATDTLSRFTRRSLRTNASPGRFQIHRQQGIESRWPLRLFSDSRITTSLIIFFVLIAVASSFYASGFINPALVDVEFFRHITRFIGAMLPPDFNPSFLSGLMKPLLQTIAISVMGTLIGIITGAVLALPATSTLILMDADDAGRRSLIERGVRWSIYVSARFISNVLRSIPELVWVLLCILAVGLGPFAGALAIGLHTGGVLGKLYAEILEEVPVRPIEALRAAGAGPLQILLWGIWPQARATLASYTILRWEMNLRVSTILGLVGGGGLGLAIYNNIQLGFYARVATLIIIIYMIVVITDWLSDRLRARPLRLRFSQH